jgi:hypothetical protein
MIDVDLAELYGVPTKRLNQQVQRNRKRFPEDFMFQLTKVEAENLRLQFATSRSSHGGRRSLPYVFTEQGVAMLSSVLNSEQAIEVNITIMRAFVKLRQMLESNEELNRKFAAVIRKLSSTRLSDNKTNSGRTCMRFCSSNSRNDRTPLGVQCL